jgi:LPXTG-motif cell wall-anchored protein
MSHRWLLRSAVGLAVAATTLVGAAAAWAATLTNPTLHQHDQHIAATDAKYKQKFCSCRPDQHPNQDAWVFVWPGGRYQVGTVQSAEIGWDTNNDGTADAFRSYPAEGQLGSVNGTPKITFLTPSGWRLETGTSVVSGKVSTFNTDGFAEGFFNLTHTCPGTTTPTTPPPSSKPPTSAPPTTAEASKSESATPTPSKSEETTAPATTTSAVETSPTTPSESGLPVTGAALSGVIIAGLAALAGGVILVLTMRRRRDNTG